MHGFPLNPTPDMLSFYLIFCSFFVKPNTLSIYLLGICSQLESHYPNCHTAQCSFLVIKTLTGVHHHHGTSVNHKDPLMVPDICHLLSLYQDSNDYDNFLFLTQLTLGFNQLLRLAKLCMPDNQQLWDCRKLMMWFEVKTSSQSIHLLLPGHKADKFFQGSKLLVLNNGKDISPYPLLMKYLACQDFLFPYCPELWLRHDGSSPTRSWFTAHLRRHFGNNISGHSMCAGGATILAAARVPNNHIHILGRWSSDVYQLYIQQHSIILLSQLAHHLWFLFFSFLFYLFIYLLFLFIVFLFLLPTLSNPPLPPYFFFVVF